MRLFKTYAYSHMYGVLLLAIQLMSASTDTAFNNFILPLQLFLSTDQVFKLSDFLDVTSIAMPPELKKSLETILVKERTVVVDSESHSIETAFSSVFFGKPVSIKFRLFFDFLEKENAASVKNQLEKDIKPRGDDSFERVSTIQEDAEQQEISNNDDLADQKLKEGALKQLKSYPSKYSLAIGLPSGFSLSSISSRLKPLDYLQYKKCLIVFSEKEYVDTVWDLKVSKGVNILAAVKVAGPLERITHLIGEQLTEIQMQGVIDPAIFGSQVSAQLPGTIKLGKNLKTKGLALTLLIKEVLPKVPGLVISIKSGLEITVPNQLTPLTLTGEVSVAAEKASFDFYMDGLWENVFNIPGLNMGNVKFKATTDYTVAAATEGILTLSGIGLGGEIAIGNKSLAAYIYGELSTTTDVLLKGELKGGVYLSDIIDFGLSIVRATTKLKEGKIAQNVQKFKHFAMEHVPNIGYEYINVMIAPKTMFFGGKKYDPGITCDVITQRLFGLKTSMHLSIDDSGISGIGSMAPLQIGPFLLTAKTVGGLGTAYDLAGPSVHLDLSPQNLIAKLVIDGGVQAAILGGIATEGHMTVSPQTVVLQFDTNIFNQFKATCNLYTSILDVAKSKIEVAFQQEGLNTLSRLLNRAASELITSTKSEIEQAKKSVQQAKEKINKLENKLSSLNDKRAKIQAKNREHIDRIRQKVLKEIQEIEVAKQKFKQAVQECTQGTPGVSKEDIEEAVLEEAPPTEEQLEKILQDLKEEGLNEEQINALRLELRKGK